jgi:Ca-activated chloride channel family protein
MALGFLCLIPLWLVYRGEEAYLVTPMAVTVKRLLAHHTSVVSRSFPFFLALIWALLVLALMRPQLIGDALEIPRDGRNIMLVLDLSESMEALDMKLDDQPVDRLVVAKDVLTSFVDKRRGDRLGLTVFGSESFLHAPLTFDHATIKRFLDDAQIGFAGPKTAIGDALGLATKKLVEEQAGDRIIVMLTDGQNNIGSLEPMQAAKIAKQHSVKIYIIGLGASRMVVDGFFGPQRINPSESLDEAEPEMRELAALTGGAYYRAKDHQGLAKIYQEIDRLEPVVALPIVLIPRKDLFYWPLGAVFLLVLLRNFFGMNTTSPKRSSLPNSRRGVKA